MRKNKIATLALLLAISFTVSCSRLGAPSDDAITTDIKAKMFSEPTLKNASVDVSSKGGVVTLTGQVPDDAARLAAYKIATQEKGVTKVNDQMSVLSAQAAPEPVAAAPAPTPEPAPRPARTRSSSKAARTHDVASASAAQPTPSADAAAAPAPPPPQLVTVTVPANTIVTVRTIDSIDSKTNHAGEVFKASLDAPIVVDNRVIVPAGADAYVKLVDAKSAGHMTGRSELGLELSGILFQGKTYNVVRVGGGAALGALIGAIAGGGKGAAIGAAVGGGAGTGVQVFTHGQQVKIPSETRLDFTLQQPLEITYVPGKRSRRQSNADQASSDQPPPNPQ